MTVTGKFILSPMYLRIRMECQGAVTVREAEATETPETVQRVETAAVTVREAEATETPEMIQAGL